MKTKTVRNSPPSRPAFHQYDPNDPQFAPLLDPSAGLSAGRWPAVGRPLAGLSAGLSAGLPAGLSAGLTAGLNQAGLTAGLTGITVVILRVP